MSNRMDYKKYFHCFDPLEACGCSHKWPIQDQVGSCADEDFNVILKSAYRSMVPIFCDPHLVEMSNGDEIDIAINDQHRSRLVEILEDFVEPIGHGGRFDFLGAIRAIKIPSDSNKYVRAQYLSALAFVLIDRAILAYKQTRLPPSKMPGSSAQLAGLSHRIGMVCASATSYLTMGWWERFVLPDIGKKTVSQRKDQQLKPQWEAHCKKAVETGVAIAQLCDLFQIEGCSTDFKRYVDARTLKRWAKESAGIEFKPGRPKK